MPESSAAATMACSRIFPVPRPRAAEADVGRRAEDECAIAAIRVIRNRRNEMNVPPSRRARLYVQTRYVDSFKASAGYFTRLASAAEVLIAESEDKFAEPLEADKCVQMVTDSATLYLPLADLIDLDKERARLNDELKRIEGEIARLSAKLSNEGFVAKAPAAVVDGERAKLAKYQENLEGVKAAISKL